MSPTATPIIFIHYGDSPYLAYTLDLARRKNPHARIILLGDEQNHKYAKNGIEFFPFASYFHSNEAQIFTRVYRFIAGAQKRKSYWTNFVFKRWFCIYGFLCEQQIDRFWTFDSDTLILTELRTLEEQYRSVACTTQCNGICMNGLVNSRDAVKGYIDMINTLFQDEAYLQQQEKEMIGHPDWAFTEMRAFATYAERTQLPTMRSTTVIGGAMFDECICQDDGMETEERPTIGRSTKKLYGMHGQWYVQCRADSARIRLHAVNMSWVPLSFIEEVYHYAVYGRLPGIIARTRYAAKKIPRLLQRWFARKPQYV